MKWIKHGHMLYELDFGADNYQIIYQGSLRWYVYKKGDLTPHLCGSLAAAKMHAYRLIIESVQTPCPECGGPLLCEGMYTVGIRDHRYGLYCTKCDSTVISMISGVKRPMLAEIALYQALRTLS